MHTEHCTHAGCSVHYTKSNKAKARAAIRMHMGRAHTGAIGNSRGSAVQNGNGHTGVLTVQPETAADAITTRRFRGLKLTPSGHTYHGRSKISAQQADALIAFIQQKRGEYPDKTACFRAALESAGVSKIIGVNASAIKRYFGKAEAGVHAATNGHATPVTAPRRKYKRRMQPERSEQNVMAAPSGTTCMLNAPGTLNVMFDAKFLPEVLHTIAFSLAGDKLATKGGRHAA